MKKTITYAIVTAMFLGTGLFLFRNSREVASVYVTASTEYYLLIGSSVAIYLAFLARRTSFIENLVHEFTHLVFALVCCRRVKGFYVTGANGMVYTEYTRYNMVITLSPYFFPLITSLMILLFTFISFRYAQPVVLISYGLFVATTIRSLFRSPDEVRSTGFTGYTFLLVMTFWVSFLVVAWSVYPQDQFLNFLKSLHHGFIGTF